MKKNTMIKLKKANTMIVVSGLWLNCANNIVLRVSRLIKVTLCVCKIMKKAQKQKIREALT